MKYIILLLSLILIPNIGIVFAQYNVTCPAGQTYDNQTKLCITCWEKGTCDFTADPFGVMMLPFERIFGGLTIVIMWGLLVSILWLRTQNPMLIGVVGIAMTAGYMTVAPEAPSNEFDGARLIGGALFAVSLGISIYHLINTRLFQPPQ
jgi:hypothetical protein